MYFFLSCYCRAEKYWFPQQNTDFWVWEYWKAQIQLGSSDDGDDDENDDDGHNDDDDVKMIELTWIELNCHLLSM